MNSQVIERSISCREADAHLSPLAPRSFIIHRARYRFRGHKKINGGKSDRGDKSGKLLHIMSMRRAITIKWRTERGGVRGGGALATRFYSRHELNHEQSAYTQNFYCPSCSAYREN